MEDVQLFNFGYPVITPGAIDALLDSHGDPIELLERHISGDWGDCDDEDKQTNDEAITEGNRIVSVYYAGTVKIFVITEWDRSVTTILRADEY